MLRNHLFLSVATVLASAAAVFCAGGTAMADVQPAVQAIVSQVSQTQYEAYHLSVESFCVVMFRQRKQRVAGPRACK